MTQYWKNLCYRLAVPVLTTWWSCCHLETIACNQNKYKCPHLGTECCRGLKIPQQQAATFNGQRMKFDVQVSPTELCYSKHSYCFKNSHQSLVSQTAFPQAVQYVHSRSARQASKKFHISAPSQKKKSVITRCFHTTRYVTFNILLV
jgi:hypothetical protein